MKKQINKTKRRELRQLPPATCYAAGLTETMAEISKDGFCVVLKCLPDGFPWIDDGGNKLIVKKWAAEASWVKHGDGYRPREHAVGDTPEQVIIALFEMVKRHNVCMSHGGHK